MPKIAPQDTQLVDLEGIHLWHAGLSSCSQRVRLTLAEKGLEFISHELDLQAGENASAAYQRIHPKGLVPAMVMDGDLYIESIDIITAIDERYPAPPLMPSDRQAKKDAKALLKHANEAQAALKLITFEFLFSAAPPPPKAQQAAFQANHRNDALKQFHLEAAQGFAPERIETAVQASKEDFNALNTMLSDNRAFLCGDIFSLADIAWMPNVHRFSLIRWPFEQTPHLKRWFTRVEQRQSYQDALIAWQPSEIHEHIVPKVEQRQAKGRGVAAFGL